MLLYKTGHVNFGYWIQMDQVISKYYLIGINKQLGYHVYRLHGLIIYIYCYNVNSINILKGIFIPIPDHLPIFCIDFNNLIIFKSCNAILKSLSRQNNIFVRNLEMWIARQYNLVLIVNTLIHYFMNYFTNAMMFSTAFSIVESRTWSSWRIT